MAADGGVAGSLREWAGGGGLVGDEGRGRGGGGLGAPVRGVLRRQHAARPVHVLRGARRVKRGLRLPYHRTEA